MEDNAQLPKIYSAGYAGSIAGKKQDVPGDFSVFCEKEPEGSVGASNLYVLSGSVEGTWQAEACARFTAKKVLYEYFQSFDYVDSNKLALSIRTANNEIYEYAKVQSEKMGASVMAAAITEGKLVIGNVGSNHAYIIRNGKVFQITEDQNAMAERVQNGEISAEEAYGDNSSDQQPAIGFEKDIVIDIYDGIEVRNNDVLLLCSQGMDSFIGKKEILEAAFEITPKGIVEALLDIPAANSNNRGASVAAIKIYDEEGIQCIVRNEGSEPNDTDLNAEAKDVELTKRSRPRTRQNDGSKKKRNNLPRILIVALLLVLLAAAVIWAATAGNMLKNVFGPKATATATIDAVQASMAVIQLTSEAEQATAVASTLQAWPTQTPLPSPTAIYFDLDVSTPVTASDGVSSDMGEISLINHDGSAMSDTGLTDMVSDPSGNLVDAGIIATDVPVVKDPIVNDKDSAEMVYVPEGNFTLGSDVSVDAYALADEETPQQEVRLDAYWIDKTEITNAQYKMCVDAGACKSSGYMLLNNSNYSDHPVTYVTQAQAEAYCEWAGGRLPTEFEWEKAARGTDGRVYPWGSEEPTLENALANIPYYINKETGQSNDLFSVGSFPNGASPYGALDMAGNAWEWTSSWYSSDTYQALSAEAEESGDVVSNPTGPEDGSTYVIRGGSSSTTESNYFQTYLRAANRGFVNMSSSYFIGFRCIVEDK